MAKLETYEWSNMWWDRPSDGGRRVLLIGDSITNGYHPALREMMPDDIYIDMYVTSRALDNPSFTNELSYMLTQGKYEVIHFNNGAHGGHIAYDEYKKLYKNIIETLLKLENKPEIILSGTTPFVVLNEPKSYTEANKFSIERDKIAAEIADELGLMYENLYNVVDGIENIRKPDPYHFNDTGSKMLAEVVCRNLKNIAYIKK